MSQPGRLRVLALAGGGGTPGLVEKALRGDPELELLVGVGTDGDASAAVRALAPDVVAVDLAGRPEDLLAAVVAVMAAAPVPILLLAPDTEEAGRAAVRGLEAGAVDVVARPGGPLDPAFEAFHSGLRRRLKVAARLPLRERPLTPRPSPAGEGSAPDPGALPPAAAGVEGETGWWPCVVVAAATGGPAALLRLIPALPADLGASVLVVQPLPPTVGRALVRELAVRSTLAVHEATEGARLRRGVVHLASGSRHVTVSRQGGLILHHAPRDGGSAPSADLAMASVARQAGPRAVAVVLTGVGRDGAEGAETIRRAGWRVLVQDPTSALAPDLPRAAIRPGPAQVVAPLEHLAAATRACLGLLEAAASPSDHGGWGSAPARVALSPAPPAGGRRG